MQRALDAQGMARRLPVAAPPAIERLGRRVVRYTWPEGRGALRRLIGKVYEDERVGRRAESALCALWESRFCDRDPRGVRIPEPCGYLADLRLLLMEDVPGEPLKALVKARRAEPRHLRLFGRALAKLHGCPLAFGEPFTVDDHLARRCHGLHEALAEQDAALAGPIRSLVARARATEDPAAFTLIHGDYHLGQAHVDGRRLWLLDLDPLCHGDPAYDLAMVLVVLKRLEADARRAPYVKALRESFLEGYFEGVPWPVAARVPLYEALIHLKRACKRYRYRDEPDWPATVRRQIAQAATCLEVMESAAVPTSCTEVIALDAACPATA